jgi:hypothetical protein
VAVWKPCVCVCVCAGITAVGTCMVTETLGVCEIRHGVEVGVKESGWGILLLLEEFRCAGAKSFAVLLHLSYCVGFLKYYFRLGDCVNDALELSETFFLVLQRDVCGRRWLSCFCIGHMSV